MWMYVSKIMVRRMPLCVECSDFVCRIFYTYNVCEDKDDELNDGMMCTMLDRGTGKDSE